MSESENHFGMLPEQVVEQNKVVLEYVLEMPKAIARLDEIEHTVAALLQDMQVVKVVSNRRKLMQLSL